MQQFTILAEKSYKLKRKQSFYFQIVVEKMGLNWVNLPAPKHPLSVLAAWWKINTHYNKILTL